MRFQSVNKICFVSYCVGYPRHRRVVGRFGSKSFRISSFLSDIPWRVRSVEKQTQLLGARKGRLPRDTLKLCGHEAIGTRGPLASLSLSQHRDVSGLRCHPKSGKGRPRFAWDANGRRTKSLEPGTLASSSEQPKEPKVPKEPKEPEEPGEPEPEEPEKLNEAELALLRDTMVHRVLPEPLYTHSSDRCFLVSDKKRQEVYLKMSQIGSLKLILAQVEVATGYKFEDGVRDFRSNLC